MLRFPIFRCMQSVHICKAPRGRSCFARAVPLHVLGTRTWQIQPAQSGTQGPRLHRRGPARAICLKRQLSLARKGSLRCLGGFLHHCLHPHAPTAQASILAGNLLLRHKLAPDPPAAGSSSVPNRMDCLTSKPSPAPHSRHFADGISQATGR